MANAANPKATSSRIVGAKTKYLTEITAITNVPAR